MSTTTARLTDAQRRALDTIERNGHAFIKDSPRYVGRDDVSKRVADRLVALGLAERDTVQLYASGGVTLPWPVIRQPAGCSCSEDPDTGDLYDDYGTPCGHG